MRNLFQMDMRRMLRSISFYIILAIVALVTISSFGLLFVVLNPEIQEKLTSMGVFITMTNPPSAEMRSIHILEILDQSGLSGGMFACLTGILCAIFLCSEYDSGFVKNVFLVHESKWSYIWSKLACLSIVNGIYLAAFFLFTSLGNLMTGSFFKWNSPIEVLIYLASVWMLENAFSALYLTIGMITRSKAAGVAAGIILGSGSIVAIISTVLGIFGMGKAMEHTIYMSLRACISSYDIPRNFIPLLTGLIFLILYMAAAKIIVQRKDV